MFHFATYFDNNYLSRGILLYDSLKANCKSFELYILCLDSESHQYFQQHKSKYPEIKTIKLSELEDADTDLKVAKTNRSIIEYYFTLSPCLPIYILKKYNLPHICTLDADILFLSNPLKVFNYLDKYSIIITPHKFSSDIKELEKYGKFNVSFQVFKNDQTGLSCLKHWRKQCIEWCYDTFDAVNQRFADQKYLDAWEGLFKDKVKVLSDNICGLAPWNLNNYEFNKKGLNYYSNGDKIVFYHFHHFKLLNSKIATNGFYFYKAKNNKSINQLYLEYWNKLIETEGIIGKGKVNDIIRRTHLSGDAGIIGKLNNEGSAYFKVSQNLILFVDFQKLSGRIVKFIVRFYA